MATKKTTKKTVAKKPAVKKAVAKAPVKRSAARTKKTAAMQSFKVYKNPPAFSSFRVTRQTVYWTLLLLVIVITQLYILKIQLDIADLTNAILENNL